MHYEVIREGSSLVGEGTVRLRAVDGDKTREVRQVIFHSPTGMEFGFHGSGPADLALTILADHLGEDLPFDAVRRGGWYRPCPHPVDENGDPAEDASCVKCDGTGDLFVPSKAMLLYQQFKAQFIAPQSQAGPFTIEGAAIDEFVMKEKERRENS